MSNNVKVVICLKISIFVVATTTHLTFEIGVILL